MQVQSKSGQCQLGYRLGSIQRRCQPAGCFCTLPNSAGVFDFPRPKDQSVRIEPYKDGWRFEPSSFVVNPGVKVESIQFRAFEENTPKAVTERHVFIPRNGQVWLADGVGLKNGQPFVNDITRQDHYAIINKGSGLCAGAKSGTLRSGSEVTMQHCDGSAKQQWKFIISKGQIKSALGNYCMNFSGSRNNGQHIKLYECNDNINQKFTFAGQRIVPQKFPDGLSFGSNGTRTGVNLQLWEPATKNFSNRKWIFERHYRVSAKKGQNIVNDPAKDNVEQKFLIVKDARARCLTAASHQQQAKLSAKDCSTANGRNGSNPVSNMAWTYTKNTSVYFYENGQFIENWQLRLNGDVNACLASGNQPSAGDEPYIKKCNAPYETIWNFNMPYWGGTADIAETIGLHSNSLFLHHPRDRFVNMGNFNNKREQQGWVFVPFSE